MPEFYKIMPFMCTMEISSRNKMFIVLIIQNDKQFSKLLIKPNNLIYLTLFQISEKVG